MTRRLRLALIFAVFLAALAVSAVESDKCAGITPDNWFLYWLYDCGKEAAGGGGSGAG